MSFWRRAVATAASIPRAAKPTYTGATEKLQWSHAIGPSTPQVEDLTTSQLLERTARRYPNHTAIISAHQNTKLDWQTYNEKVSQVATNMYEFGWRKGDRIGVCAGNIWEYPILQMALARLGAILVPLNPAFKAGQHASALSRTQAKGLIIQSYLYEGNRRRAADTIDIVKHLRKELPDMDIFSLPHHIHGQNDSLKISRGVFEGESLFKPVETRKFETSPNEVVNMQFTSGTTSAPKISCLTHRNLVNNAIYAGKRLGFSAEGSHHPTGQDHYCIPVPMFHTFGLVLSNLLCAATGTAEVFASEAFDAVRILEAVRNYDCTGLCGVPTMFVSELSQPYLIPKNGFKYLRTGIVAGAVMPPPLVERLRNEMGGFEAINGYGMTETSPLTFMGTLDDSPEVRQRCIGKLLPNSECKIVNPSDSSLTPLPIGAKGEVITSGYALQTCYYEDPVKTDEAMVKDQNGKIWMRTGDEGVLDEDGNLTVTGRIKDLIIRGGENINPQDIENLLFSHPSVSEASVVAVPDEKYGEEIGAFIVLKQSAEVTAKELRDFIKESLGHFMVPKYIRFELTLPKTTSGKIRKVELRETAVKLLNENAFE